jgi:tetratricopeptide (TPR) repeat protein
LQYLGQVSIHLLWTIKGQGLSGIGLNQITMGPLDKAVLNLKEAIKLLKSIPDYYALADSSNYLARCYRKQGELQTAHAILKETEKMIIEKNFQGFVVSMFYNALAETYLSLFENSIEVSENITIGKIKKYILKTTKYAKHFKCGQPKALRLNGSFYWLKGDLKNAKKFWGNALNLCQELGCRNEEGLIYLDMGKRMSDITFLEKAQDIFVENRATLDQVNVKKAIGKLK